MMDWYQIISYLVTNEIRIVFGLFLVIKAINFSKLNKHILLLSFGGGILVSICTAFTIPQFYTLGVEICVLLAITYCHDRDKTKMCLFLFFFYEVGIALWEFLISAGLAVLLKEPQFTDSTTIKYMIAVWVVRLFMICMLLLMKRNKQHTQKDVIRFISIVAVTGLFGLITLSEQTIIPFSDDTLTQWIILSMLLVLAVLFYHINRQYEMEKEIAQCKEEQVKLIERDYQTLNRTYSENAKLYHDIHNHIEVLYCYLAQGKAKYAIRYLDDLRSPIQEMVQSVWIGDEAIDYLISSKLAFAEQHGIQTRVNIEFPQHTDIRSVDLIAILGNLLDNALEAAIKVNGDLRFLNLTIRRINNMLIIKVENSVSEIPVVIDGSLQTSKQNKSLHGWGLKSALNAAERYEGTVETSCNNGIFTTVATLSYNAVR